MFFFFNFQFCTEVVSGSKGYSLDGGLAHEAGFDAYLTGLCFITMVKSLGEYFKMGDKKCELKALI